MRPLVIPACAAVLMLAPVLAPALAGQFPQTRLLTERAQSLAFQHAAAVLRVTVQRVVGMEVQVEIRELLHGFQVPKQLSLLHVESLGAVRPGERWIVATAAARSGHENLSCLCRLPDTPPQLARVRAWALPIHRHAPLVFLARGHGMREGRIQFEVERVLRGAIRAGGGLANHHGYRIHWPALAQGERYLVSVSATHALPKRRVRLLTVRSLRKVGAAEVVRLTAEFATEVETAGHLDPAPARKTLRELSEAWRFMSSPLVAVADAYKQGLAQATGAGGEYLLLYKRRMLRPLDPEAELDPERIEAPRFGLPPGEPSRRPLFRTGGHGQHFRHVTQTMLCAGDRVGAGPRVFIPYTEENLLRIQACVAARPPRFADADPTRARQLPAAADVFMTPLPMQVFARRRDPVPGAWVRLEVSAAQQVQAAGQQANQLTLRCLGTEPAIPSLLGKHWRFVAGRVPDWRVGSQVWGFALCREVPLSPLVATAPAAWVFLSTSFLPVGEDPEHRARLLRRIADDTWVGAAPDPFGAGLGRREVRAALSLSRELLHETFRSADPRRSKQLEETLRHLGQRLSYRDASSSFDKEPTPAADLQSKLVTFAVQLRNDPGVYRELRARYCRSVDDRRSRGPRAPDLLPEHCTARHRWAWELLLLSPSPRWSTQWDKRAAVALARIGDEASIATVLELYRLSTLPGVDVDRVGWAQVCGIEILSSFVSPRALAALLRCRRMSVEQRQRVGAGVRLWDAPGHVEKMLAAEAWRGVVEAYPEDGLEAEERALLGRVRRSSPASRAK